MSSASLVILLVGALILALKGLRLFSLWRDARGDRLVAPAPFPIEPLPESISSDETGAASEDDLGVALALALRDAEADAKGKWSTLDSP